METYDELKKRINEMTDDEIRKLVYSQTFQETNDEIETFIRGAIWLKDEFLKLLTDGKGTSNGDQWSGLFLSD